MAILAKLFMSGRSQAIRWPAKLRLDAKEVEIEQMGDAFLVRPLRQGRESMGTWLQRFYANTAPLPDTFLADRGDTPPQQRDWG